MPVAMFWFTVAQGLLLLGSGALAVKWQLEASRPERPKPRLVYHRK